MEYKIAYAREDGEWDIAQTFTARHDHEANMIAEGMMLDDQDWYVLDEQGSNINGGQQ